jgi:hypothetical protein
MMPRFLSSIADEVIDKSTDFRNWHLADVADRANVRCAPEAVM